MTERRLQALVHADWSDRWFAGDPGLCGIFGPPAVAPDLLARAGSIPERSAGLAAIDWCGDSPPDDTLLVLAGQQPVLLGGPGLVVHKCATAIALARELRSRLERPVRPVFLLATQDHDSSEVDHLDLNDPSNGHLRRIRAQLAPRNEMFARASWQRDAFEESKENLKSLCGIHESSLLDSLAESPLAGHVRQLLKRIFGSTDLGIVAAHELPWDSSLPIYERALRDLTGVRSSLLQGASTLERAGLRVPFDPDDPRPIVLRSSHGRRRRLEAGESTEALGDLAKQPHDFSPHAALRPVIQAATLPVVAQVVGPSELLYLGQARSLHDWAGVPAPVLVPRLEATVVAAHELDRAQELLERVRSADGFEDSEIASLAHAAERHARALTRAVARRAPALGARARRVDQRIARDLRRLARAPVHHALGRDGLIERVRPRGRAQDSVLAWLPEAMAAHDPRAWAESLIRFARPLESPRHVLYARASSGPSETPHG